MFRWFKKKEKTEPFQINLADKCRKNVLAIRRRNFNDHYDIAMSDIIKRTVESSMEGGTFICRTVKESKSPNYEKLLIRIRNAVEDMGFTAEIIDSPSYRDCKALKVSWDVPGIIPK